MKTVTNKFGTGELYQIEDITGDIYVRCTACMSIYTDFLSWAEKNFSRMSEIPEYADSIIILGCQVTDLAILNDLNHASEFKDRDVYMGGCLAQRFDIELPSYIKRLDVVRIENQPINKLTFTTIDFAKPFWEKDFEETESISDNLKPGHLFRNYYPLKIGAGCKGKCKFCTIRDTRGDYYAVAPYSQIDEFLANDNVVLISDSPTIFQIEQWCKIATEHNKPISFRNVEPQVMIACKNKLYDLAKKGLLDILHVPIQSDDMNIVKLMGRDSKSTQEFLEWSPVIRNLGTKLATNIICDYIIEEYDNGLCKVNINKNIKFLNKHFDYWVWNPHFDGNWDRERAELRWEYYFGN